ncbi:MAG: zinc-binding dehydrogenase [Chloroflexota bacterium]
MVNSIPCYLLTKTFGAFYRPAHWGPLALLRYREVDEPRLPGPQWVRIRTRYGGICGSDLNTVLLKDSPALSAFTSFPFTLGHENVGTIAEVGAEVPGFAASERVVVEPLLPCAARGFEEPCEFCQRGQFSLCLNFTRGSISPGLGIGSCRDTGGSWSPYFVAHRSQLFHLPEAMSDENALMVEPFAVALHVVLRSFPKDGDTVLILGAGVVGLCTLAALRALGSRARVIVVDKYPFQGEMARAFGADQVIGLRDGDYLRAVAEATGGTLRKPILGKRVLVGGADLVYECVGSARSVDDSLRLTRSGGTVVLVGLAGILRGVDWTPIWLNELTVKGSFWCGTESVGSRNVRTFQRAVEMIAQRRPDLSPLVTHRFRLDEYRKALAMTADRGRHRVVKSAFVFD